MLYARRVETIPAKELVVGFPVHAKVVAAQRGTIRIETEGRVYGLNLETGAHIAPKPEAVHAPPFALATTNLVDVPGRELGEHFAQGRSFTLWGGRATTLPDLSYSSTIKAGSDACVIICTSSQIHTLDRRSGEHRSIAVPKPLELGDRVTGGTRGLLNGPPIYIEPGFVVFVRSPALLVVALEDLERALVFDTAQWSIETVLAIREKDHTTPATRGKWREDTVVTATGSLNVHTGSATTPVWVVDRLWPPNGWARVELADHTSVPVFKPPPEHRAFQVPVARYDLFLGPPTTITWPAIVVPPANPPPAELADLVHAPPAPTFAGAVVYARTVQLEARTGVTGKPLGDAHTLLTLARSPEWRDRHKALEAWQLHLIARRRLAPDAAYVVPALIALAADPTIENRTGIAELVGRIAKLARTNAAAAGVLVALRRCLPLILGLREATTTHAKVWSFVIRQIAHQEPTVAWHQRARELIPELRNFAAAAEMAFDDEADEDDV